MVKSMKRRIPFIFVATVLACSLLPSAAFADGAMLDLSCRPEEKTDFAQSWRYSDGELIDDSEEIAYGDEFAISLFSVAPRVAAWSKTDAGYVNGRGEVIPNATRKGVDVSVHNGTIDWEKVKAAGIDFAILRCGYGQDIASQDDKQWERNLSECERLDIPYGVYLYSYATSPYGDGKTTNGASGEADHVLRLLEGHTPTYPVYYDLEEESMARPLYVATLANMATVFCEKIAAAGYNPGVYANTHWHNNYLTDPVFDNWDRWVAQYNYQCEFPGTYQLWQCTSSGKVDGITGNNGNVDLNFELGEFYGPSAIPFTWVCEDGKWYYRSGNVNAKGWRNVDGQRYYMNNDGVRQTNWQKINDVWYFFDAEGPMHVGWLDDCGKRYYLDVQGKMLTGTQIIDGKQYVFDSSGALISSEENGFETSPSAVGAKWEKKGGTWYLKSADGKYLKGWQKVMGSWYYLRSSGAMATGWQKVGGSWYYLRGSGAMAEGWAKVSGKWYYLNPGSGAMARGWKQVGDTWYYLRSSGAMATGWQKVGGSWYYFNSSGAMAVDVWIDSYHVNTSGVWDNMH